MWMMMPCLLPITIMPFVVKISRPLIMFVAPAPGIVIAVNHMADNDGVITAIMVVSGVGNGCKADRQQEDASQRGGAQHVDFFHCTFSFFRCGLNPSNATLNTC